MGSQRNFENNIIINFKKCEASFVNKPLPQYIEEKKKEDQRKYNKLGKINRFYKVDKFKGLEDSRTK